MPLFEYSCMQCKKRFELLVTGKEHKASCPYCSSKEVKKLMSKFSAPGVDSNSICTGCPSADCSSCGK